MLATCVFNAISTCSLDDWRLVDTKLDTDAELDTMERRVAPVEKATPMEKAASAVENAMAGG
jgi:hypothetical protein